MLWDNHSQDSISIIALSFTIKALMATMKRIAFLFFVSLLITGCPSEHNNSVDKTVENMPKIYSVEIWVDSNPDDFQNSIAMKVASSKLIQKKEYVDLYSLPSPLRYKLPSGLEVEIYCERVSTGHIHVSISHDGALISSSKYSGPFTTRFFLSGQDSYILNVVATE